MFISHSLELLCLSKSNVEIFQNYLFLCQNPLFPLLQIQTLSMKKSKTHWTSFKVVTASTSPHIGRHAVKSTVNIKSNFRECVKTGWSFIDICHFRLFFLSCCLLSLQPLLSNFHPSITNQVLCRIFNTLYYISLF